MNKPDPNDIIERLKVAFDAVGVCRCGMGVDGSGCDSHSPVWSPCPESQLLNDALNELVQARARAERAMSTKPPARRRGEAMAEYPSCPCRHCGAPTPINCWCNCPAAQVRRRDHETEQRENERAFIRHSVQIRYYEPTKNEPIGHVSIVGSDGALRFTFDEWESIARVIHDLHTRSGGGQYPLEVRNG